jgi:hypothetical protein
VAVFAVFGGLQAMIFKQFGVGLAAAILIDATIIRGILLPGSMALLDDWNWYLPRWLQWLPHLEHGSTLAAPEPTAVPVPPASSPPDWGSTDVGYETQRRLDDQVLLTPLGAPRDEG